MRPYLVEWWEARLYYEQNARDIAHQERLVSLELLAMYNRPRSVVDLQVLHDDVLWHVGAFQHELIGPISETE